MPTDEATTILNRDVLGRVTISKEQREALLDKFERSGLKGLPFGRLYVLRLRRGGTHDEQTVLSPEHALG
jgi:hypothetical protein